MDISMDISMDITLARLQIFNDYLCGLSLYLSFLFVFLLFVCSFEGLRIFKGGSSKG